MAAGGTAAFFPVGDCANRYAKKGTVVISGLPDRYTGGVQIPQKGSSVLFHRGDFDHVVGVIAHLCLAEPGNAEVTFSVNIGKIF